MEVIQKLLSNSTAAGDEKTRFIRFNYRILLGLLEGMMPNSPLTQKAHQGEEGMLERMDEIFACFSGIKTDKDFPITRWHLQNARQQLASSPLRKGKQQLDEFLETELSREPQVGFVVGVGANDPSGVLLPIASTLVYRMYPEKIVVTGAVSVFKNLFHKDALVDKWTFSTNGVSIMGMENIPCIGFGPGNEVNAHAPNESVEKNHLVAAAAFYAALPLNYVENAK